MKRNLVRIDMTEYMEKFSVSRLIEFFLICRLARRASVTEAVCRKL